MQNELYFILYILLIKIIKMYTILPVYSIQVKKILSIKNKEIFSYTAP